MTARRGLPFVLAPLVGTAVAVAVFASTVAHGQSGVSAFEQAGGVAAVVGLALAAAAAHPAWTLSVGVALTAFSGHWANVGLPLPLDRLFLAIGVGRVLMRQWGAAPHARIRTEPIHWLLGLAVIYAVLSAFVAGTINSGSLSALFDRFGIVPFLIFFVAPLAFPTGRERRILLGTLVALGAYLGLTALFERVGPSALVWPKYILDPSVGIHADRARGPFVEALANGLTLYACAVAAVVAAVIWRDRRWRAVAVGVAGLCALGVLLTVTRAAWISAVAGTLVALLAAPQARRLALPSALLGLLLVLGAFAVFPGLRGQSQQRADDQKPLWDRRNSNAAAERMIERRPLFGFGWGTYPRRSPDYYRQSPDYPLTVVGEAHNTFLSNAAELGLIGATLWLLAWLAALSGSILRRGPPEIYPWRIGLLAIAVSSLIAANTSPFGFVLPTLILWTWAGVVRGAAPIPVPTSAVTLRRPRPSPSP